MSAMTALDLSTQRFACPAYRLNSYGRPAGPACVRPRPARRKDSRRLLLSLAGQAIQKFDSLALSAEVTYEELRGLAARCRGPLEGGLEACAFGTILATFLGSVWFLGA